LGEGREQRERPQPFRSCDLYRTTGASSAGSEVAELSIIAALIIRRLREVTGTVTLVDSDDEGGLA
jgi:hypothetical protein